MTRVKGMKNENSSRKLCSGWRLLILVCVCVCLIVFDFIFVVVGATDSPHAAGFFVASSVYLHKNKQAADRMAFQSVYID